MPAPLIQITIIVEIEPSSILTRFNRPMANNQSFRMECVQTDVIESLRKQSI